MQLLGGAEVRFVALDLRGTLIAPPRHQNLTRALATLALSPTGASAEAVLMIEQEARKVAGERLARGDFGSVDGTLATLCTFGMLLAEAGFQIAGADLARMMFVVEEEYCGESRALHGDAEFADEIQRLAHGGVQVGVVADGPVYREQRVLTAALPISTNAMSFFFASGQFGVNKHSADYFAAVASALDVHVPTELLVVADRVDKDLMTAQRCGCQSVLVGETTDEWTPRLPTALDALRAIR